MGLLDLIRRQPSATTQVNVQESHDLSLDTLIKALFLQPTLRPLLPLLCVGLLGLVQLRIVEEDDRAELGLVVARLDDYAGGLLYPRSPRARSRWAPSTTS